ncbi:MAG: MFS transporter, partial [Proteobacteria bacterium]|nr:MFS transporter [Pseudomonadota bacterium]
MASPRPRPLPALHRLFPNVYYGWIVTAACSVLSFLVVGIGFYGMVVFLDALVVDRGWDRASVSGATSLYWITTGVTGIAIGRAIDRAGTRGFMAAGAVAMSGALLAIGAIREPWQLYPVYVLLGIGFALCGSVPVGAIMTRWFVARRARAMSLSMTGVSLGGMLLVPWMTALVQSEGLQATVGVLAVLLVVVVLPLTAFVLRFDPADHGLQADGVKGEGAPPGAFAARAHDVQHRLWRRREVLRTRTFWMLAASFGLLLFCQVAFLMHQLAYLREPLGPAVAALAVSATAGSSMVARLVVGVFADRVRKRELGVALFVLQAAALVIFIQATTPFGLFAGAILMGVTIGN